MMPRLLDVNKYILLPLLALFVFGYAMASYGCMGEGKTVTYVNRIGVAVWVNLGGAPKDSSGPYEVDPKIRNDGPIPAGKIDSFFNYSIPPGRKLGERVGKYVITALTDKNEIVYQHAFTWTELDDMDWTVVIEPGQSS